MVTNLHRVNYDGTPNKNGDWWVWKETCDRCGKLIIDEKVQHSSNLDALDEVNFCSDCCRFFINNNTPYEEAIVLYGRNSKKRCIH